MENLLRSNQGINKPRSVLGHVNPNTARPLAGNQKPGFNKDPSRVFKTTPVSKPLLPSSESLTNQVAPPNQATPSFGVHQENANAAVTAPTPTKVEELDWKSAQKELDKVFAMQSRQRMKGVPKIAMPEIFEKNGVKLYEHQVEGIRWLVHKEKTNEEVPPFYKKRPFGSKQYWRCRITGTIHKEDPEPLHNSILADE